MIGWIVEKMSRSGWRQKWRRFRPVTTAVSVMFVSALLRVGTCRRGRGRAGSVTGVSGRATAGPGRAGAGAGGPGGRRGRQSTGDLRLSVLSRRLTGQLKEDVVERRPP